jgi:hypothetical protein
MATMVLGGPAPTLPRGGNTLAALSLYYLVAICACLQSCQVAAAFVNARSSFHRTTSTTSTTTIRTPLLLPLQASVADGTTTAADVALLGSTTVSKEHYDIVSVDLDDGRDYPIYIGTGYSEEEGRKRCLVIGFDSMLFYSQLTP